MTTHTAYVGIGANLGQRAESLARAAAHLAREQGVTLRRVSPVYESEPQGPVRAQRLFYNAVAELHTALDPPQLLARCLALEARMGRVRGVPQGPRTIDLDLLLVDGLVGRWPGLELPHPRIAARAFVLRPLLDLQPELVDPRTARRLADALPGVVGQPLWLLGPLGPLADAERSARAAAAVEAPCA